LRAWQPKIGLLSLQSRLSGRQYDDDANAFLLHGFFQLDAYGSHDLGKRVELFASVENLFDRAIEVSKTPSTTLGQPRTARFGFLLRIGAGK
jgi:outer membrane receptor protein involved in Fe transport